MAENNTGRAIQVKKAFNQYLLAGIDEMLPITDNLQRCLCIFSTSTGGIFPLV
ncbi:MAG: hypothetical protein KA221_00765 [Vitreoscilla sp.]|nr:hypothetical protein [Vitreoscilla sp.]